MINFRQLILDLRRQRRNKEANAFEIIENNANDFNARLKALEAKNLKYYCRAYLIANTPINSAAPTLVSLGGTDYPQFGNMHDNTVNPTDIRIMRDGVYVVGAGAYFEADVGGTYRQIRILRTRSGVVNSIVALKIPPVGTSNDFLSTCTAIHLRRDDVIQLEVEHDAGAAIDVLLYDSIHRTFLTVMERMEDLDTDELGLIEPIERG